MTGEGTVYLDSSALVKLVVQEAESAALRRDLRTARTRASCALARVEVEHAVSPQGGAALRRARAMLNAMELLQLDDVLLTAAATLARGPLRTLDALHLAAASALGEDLDALITYDRRMADAATALDMRVRTPGLRR